ncbi:hypothetical protein K505DRAFT_252408 [Melanomma pulvis-pyrius CBS 109.77]|uniref:Uncharacterized protein n=1 Tax=Melanomma pulvis-pyrius CBS 109.77 TaxID=1314802 RepID=A0A6A6X0I3_9PLEO|nr:hypothetical protein K505DRAFT_252408 [Melanomma pulvis-pyrius CBS 109.77]
MIRKQIKESIQSIPGSKLTALPTSSGTIFEDQDFHLDMQGVRSLITGSSQKHNLQVQINKKKTPQ